MQVNSAEPSTSSSDGPSVRIPVDVRRFPWIRRLAADYAYDFRAVAPFFSGDPSDRAAWADAIARTQAHDRRRGEIAAVIAGQQERRQAPPRAREAGRLLADRPHGRRRHRPAGRAVRRTALHAAEGADGAEARRAGVARSQGPRRRRLLDRRRGSRLGGSPIVYGLRRDADAAHGLAAGAARRRAGAGRHRPPRRLHPRRPRRTRTHPPAHRIPRRRSSTALRRAYAPGVGMAEAFGRWMEEVLGPRGLVVYDSSDPGVEAARQPGVRARAVDAGADRQARRAGRIRSRPRAATTRRCTRRTTASRCFT